MGKTIFILRDNSSVALLDSIIVTLKSKVSPFTEYNSVLEPIAGSNNGTRIFDGLPANNYDLKYDGVIQTALSPLFIAGPEVGIPWSLSTGSIGTLEIADSAVTEIKIGTAAVTALKIGSSAVTASKIANNAVTASKIPASSITKDKLANAVFGSGMLSTSTGWQPNLDAVTIGYTSANKLELKTGAVASGYLAANAVTPTKVASNAITQDKIADGAIIRTKIGSAAVGIDEIANDAVTSLAIAAGAVTVTAIGTGAVTFDKLDSTATALINKVPNKVAFVSPAYSSNVSPYFDNISAAIVDVTATAGTVIVEPGIYIEQLTIGASVNIIGIDKTRCIINYIPTSLKPAAIDITGIDSEDILIKNLTIKCLSDNGINIPAYGIRLSNANGSFVRGEDLLIKVKSMNDSITPEKAYGINTGVSDFIFERCQIEVEGGQHLLSGTGADAYGVYMDANSTGIFNEVRIRSIGGGGATSGKGYGFYYNGNTNIGVSVERSTVESLESDKLTIVSSFYSTVAQDQKIYSCQYNGPATNINTTFIIASTQNSNIEIIPQL